MNRKAILWVSLVLALCATARGVSSEGLWAYYPIGENDFTDHSGNGHDGTPVDGAVTVQDATRGWVASFTAQPSFNSRIIAGTEDPAAGGQLTVCAWVKWGGLNSSWQGVAGKGFSYDDRRWIFQLRNTDGFIQWGGADRLQLHVFSTAALPVNQWAHVAGTCDGTSKYIYINGQAVGQGTGGFSAEAAAANVTIGWAEDQTNSDVGFNGVMDEIYLFGRGLSEEEVLMLMQGLSPELASEPHPPDQATAVARDVTLTWKPGKYAATHDVYYGTSADDVNNAGRSNPMGVLVSQGQTNTQFSPPRLALGQTYYWRVDEVNAAPSTTIFKGKLWSFTAEPIGYVMTGITATASSAIAGSGPENTINGSGLDVSDLHSSDTTQMWVTPKGAGAAWIQYAFDRVYKMHEMWVWNYNGQFENILGFGIKNAAVEYSVDGTTWTKLGDFDFARAPAALGYAHNTAVSFGGVSARYVKISVNSGWGTRGQFGLSEVRFFYVPVQALYPSPATGTTGLSPDLSLSWQPGREAVSHKVFLGTDAGTVAAGTAPAATVAQSTYTPGNLAMGTTYYWRVDEVNTAATPSTWEGNVWSFSTLDYIVVDDMEAYNDETNSRVFDFWVDGWGTTTNGGQVGYSESPFSELTTRHGGAQSMPFTYNNTAAATVSEATRTFDKADDWTRAGIKTLTLYFYGDPNNVVAQLYIKVNGTKIVYNGDQSDVTRRRWTQWNADLSAVSASVLKSVKTLTIGVGNGAGSGRLLIDNIRLYHTAPALPTSTNPGTAGLFACYTMSNNVQDSSGNGNNGTTVGTLSYTTGLGAFGTALRLNGSGDCVDLGNKAAFNPTGSFSVSLWANAAEWSTSWVHVMIANRGEPAGGPGWAIRRYSDNNLCFTTRGVGTTAEDTASTTAMRLNEWIHIVCVYNQAAGTKTIYLNGVESGAGTTTPGSSIKASTHKTYIGARANIDNTGPEAYFNGALDEIRLYNRALSASEAEYLSDPTP
jgi:hypothetical protein